MPSNWSELTQGYYPANQTINSGVYKDLQNPVIDVLSDKSSKKILNYMTMGLIPIDRDVNKLGDKSRIVTRLFNGTLPLSFRPEGSEIELGTIPVGPEKMTTFSEYGLKIQFTDTALNDDRVGLKSKGIELLQKAVNVSQNFNFAKLFDGGFGTTASYYLCADKLPLYSTAHLSYASIPTRSNYIQKNGADLALDTGGEALELATLYMAKYRDMSGNPSPIGTEKLVLLVPPDLYPTAQKLVQSRTVNAYMPQTPAQGTPQFLINNGIWEVIQCPWLQRTGAYHILSPNDIEDLKFFIREEPKIRESWNDDETMNSISIRGRWATELVDSKGLLGGKSA